MKSTSPNTIHASEMVKFKTQPNIDMIYEVGSRSPNSFINHGTAATNPLQGETESVQPLIHPSPLHHSSDRASIRVSSQVVAVITQFVDPGRPG